MRLRFKDTVLSMPEEHQVCGWPCAIWRHNSKPIDPPAPVTSTRRSRHEPARVGAAHDWSASQQIRDIDVAETIDADVAVEQLEDTRHDARFDTLPAALFRHLAKQRAGRRSAWR